MFDFAQSYLSPFAILEDGRTMAVRVMFVKGSLAAVIVDYRKKHPVDVSKIVGFINQAPIDRAAKMRTVGGATNYVSLDALRGAVGYVGRSGKLDPRPLAAIASLPGFDVPQEERERVMTGLVATYGPLPSLVGANS